MNEWLLLLISWWAHAMHMLWANVYVCTIHVQYMYSTCTLHVQYMYIIYNAKVPELEKLIFITCKSADSGKMLAILGG